MMPPRDDALLVDCEIIISKQDNNTVTIEYVVEGTTERVFENLDFPECGIITLSLRGDA